MANTLRSWCKKRFEDVGPRPVTGCIRITFGQSGGTRRDGALGRQGQLQYDIIASTMNQTWHVRPSFLVERSITIAAEVKKLKKMKVFSADSPQKNN